MSAAAVRQLLDGEASDDALAHAVEEARLQLAAHFKVVLPKGYYSRLSRFRSSDLHPSTQ